MSTSTGELRQRKATSAENDAPTTEDNTTSSESTERPSARLNTNSFKSFDFIFLLVATVAIILAAQNLELLTTPDRKIFTKEELAKFDGADGSPMYIAILGEVYDVTKGERYYGKNKGYYCFVATDGSRAYVTGKFADEITDDVSDFNAEQHGELVNWRNCSKGERVYVQEYAYKGKVIGAFYNEKGKETEALKAVEEGSIKADTIKAQREEAKRLNPNCNSKWAQGKGGEVWCSEGYPRLTIEYFPGAEPKKRCACFQDQGVTKNKQLYADCKPDATHCFIPPKEEELKQNQQDDA